MKKKTQILTSNKVIELHSDIIYLNDLQQQTEEWFKLREQRPMTSSHAATILAMGKGLEKLVLARNFEGKHFSNEHTERGNRLEPFAIKAYERITGNKVNSVGFVINDSITEYGGSSPDGLVGEKGLVEVKAPADKKFKIFLDDIEKGKFKIDQKYYYQMQHQLLITERDWVDFITYNENFEYPIIITRVFPDKLIQEKLKLGMKIGENLIKKHDEWKKRNRKNWDRL